MVLWPYDPTYHYDEPELMEESEIDPLELEDFDDDQWEDDEPIEEYEYSDEDDEPDDLDPSLDSSWP